ncbi:MAG: low-specificity L-threonine aldolase [Chloroflexi bacterium]|nr:low-specificity L-threonine aldolase [Chloroflexota bacterium]
MRVIDLRSDTVTQPTSAMREAMAGSKLGDDVYGEDPTVNQLQQMAAEILGKEAGLLVPSGTMGNLVAVLAHCGRGDEIILGNMAHTFLFEAGGIAALGGVHSHTIPNRPDGTLALDDIRGAIRPDDAHFPVTRLVTIENTHNRCGGSALSVAYTESVAALAREHGLTLHLDGARIFNAAAALDVEPAQLTNPVDSVTFCLSKGLSAPVGSILCGTKEFIVRAHRIRKQLGGGMRQAGVIAAAGIVALKDIAPRLKEDHVRAQNLAHGFASVSGITPDTDNPPSNMVYLSLDDTILFDAKEIAEKLSLHNVLVGVVGDRRFRLVLHHWIDDQAVSTTLAAFENVLMI